MNTFQDYDNEETVDQELMLTEDGYDNRAVELKCVFFLI